jgi:hypothetical protein
MKQRDPSLQTPHDIRDLAGLGKASSAPPEFEIFWDAFEDELPKLAGDMPSMSGGILTKLPGGPVKHVDSAPVLKKLYTGAQQNYKKSLGAADIPSATKSLRKYKGYGDATISAPKGWETFKKKGPDSTPNLDSPFNATPNAR